MYVSQDNLIKINIKKRNVEKLVLETCTKTSFIPNGKCYDQIDGGSMESSLGHIPANILMTELEKSDKISYIMAQ